MITLLIGENSYAITEALQRIVASFDGDVERIDGSELELRQLPDLFMGATLFSTKRLVIIKGLSENKTVWEALPDWLPRISDDVHVVFVETKPDKRTKTYKDLVKNTEVQEFAAWSERDTVKAEQWVVSEATARGFELDRKSAQTLVGRVGADQWELSHALEKLSVLDTVSPQIIEDTIEANPSENVFNLLDAALRGETAKVTTMLRTLEQTEDPYMVFGLLSAQVFQLAALAHTDKPAAEVAKDIAAHPFALSKLAPHAQRLGKTGAKKALSVFASADTAMKTSGGEPWILVEKALITVAQK